MSEPIISVSGLRGTIGDQLTPVVASNYVAAWASTLPKGKVVIGRDGRESGKLLAQAVAATLAAHGLTAVHLDVAATPTVGVAVRTLGAVAGVQISASHNPKQYNGLKLFGSEGRVLPKTEGEGVLAAYRAGKTQWSSVDDLGSISSEDDPHADHLDLVLKTVDVDAIRAKSFKVLLDSNRGAGSILGRRLLEALGCTVEILGETPDGQFEHTPEPTAENLVGVRKQVTSASAAVGFCQDPDADRLAVIDEMGRYIGEELTLALCLQQALPKLTGGGQGTVVTNCATSSVSKAVTEQLGCTPLQSAVGEANVCDLMIAEKAVFGGEGNGGPIDPAVGYVRDSFVGMARILDLLASDGGPLSKIVDGLPKYAMHKDKIDLDTEKLPALIDAIKSAMPEAKASMPDGLKLQWPDSWLLVRGSNTEPIVRLIAEAPTLAAAQDICAHGIEISKQL
ncbi:MAG: phosphoglucosamine mutase [Aureliella sp.]